MEAMTKPEILISPEKTEIPKKPTILFVCTGNTCRSPMAAALYNHLYGDTATAVSAGLAADGSPISENAKVALMERGVLPTSSNNYTAHISRRIDEGLMAKADTVVGITGGHAMSLMFTFPAHASKIFSMPTDISDPYGGTLDHYRRTLCDIETALQGIADEFKGATGDESHE